MTEAPGSILRRWLRPSLLLPDTEDQRRTNWIFGMDAVLALLPGNTPSGQSLTHR